MYDSTDDDYEPRYKHGTQMKIWWPGDLWPGTQTTGVILDALWDWSDGSWTYVVLTKEGDLRLAWAHLMILDTEADPDARPHDEATVDGQALGSMNPQGAEYVIRGVITLSKRRGTWLVISLEDEGGAIKLVQLPDYTGLLVNHERLQWEKTDG